MTQNNSTPGNGGFQANSGTTGSTSGGSTGSGTSFGSAVGDNSSAGAGTGSSMAGGSSSGTDSEVCATCGSPLGSNQGLQQFLGKMGITEEMIGNLKNSVQNVDFEQYLNTAREYLKTGGDSLKAGSDKATSYAKENPGKVAAGVAVLAVGAGLLISAMNKSND
jgi:hypothetical protein